MYSVYSVRLTPGSLKTPVWKWIAPSITSHESSLVQWIRSESFPTDKNNSAFLTAVKRRALGVRGQLTDYLHTWKVLSPEQHSKEIAIRASFWDSWHLLFLFLSTQAVLPVQTSSPFLCDSVFLLVHLALLVSEPCSDLVAWEGFSQRVRLATFRRTLLCADGCCML